MRKNQTVSLPSFVESIRDEADEFEKFWERENASNPECFPWLMESGEWAEQFLGWLNTRRHEKASVSETIPHAETKPGDACLHCPHCGWKFLASQLNYGHVPDHLHKGEPCEGNGQHPRTEGDNRALWSEEERLGGPSESECFRSRELRLITDVIGDLGECSFCHGEPAPWVIQFPGDGEGRPGSRYRFATPGEALNMAHFERRCKRGEA